MRDNRKLEDREMGKGNEEEGRKGESGYQE